MPPHTPSTEFPAGDASAVPAAWEAQKDGSIHGGNHPGFRRFSSAVKPEAPGQAGPALAENHRLAPEPSSVEEEHDAYALSGVWNTNEAAVHASAAEA